MLQLIDYIFYRTYVAYKKKDDPAKFCSIMYLSVCFFSLLLPLYAFFRKIVSPKYETQCFYVYILFWVISIASITYRYYKNDFISRLYYRYENCWADKNIHTFFIFLTMPICIAFGMWGGKTIAQFCDNHNLVGIGFDFLIK